MSFQVNSGGQRGERAVRAIATLNAGISRLGIKATVKNALREFPYIKGSGYCELVVRSR